MCWELTNHCHAFLRREHSCRRRGSIVGLQAPCNGTCGNDQEVPSTICADADLRILLANSKSLSFSALIFGKAQERLDESLNSSGGGTDKAFYDKVF
jgi:hypothetical protein